MGLCKCPKKKVTNQFCFEHRVNVCEHCMVSNHTKCVVQSYLQWLQDSDYDPNCQLCKNVLADGECVRLICYHIFHWSCLNKYACEFPPHTAPAGYTCPTCSVCIFPPSNVVSPVADILRNTLLGENWARSGLGFPVISEESPPEKLQETDVSPSHWKQTASKANKQNPQTNTLVNTSYMGNTTTNSVRPEPYGASFTASTFSTPRKMYDSTEHGLYHRTVVDHDEDKYKRRSAFEWFSRWFNSRTPARSHRRDPQVFYKRWVVILILSLIAFCTVIIFFLRMGRAGVDSDPLLDPHLNPNIRVRDNDLGGLVAPQAQRAAPAIDNIPSDDNGKLGLPVK